MVLVRVKRKHAKVNGGEQHTCKGNGNGNGEKKM